MLTLHEDAQRELAHIGNAERSGRLQEVRAGYVPEAM
jgi:hypothetical protein